jgi:hypothetical protein
MRAAIQKAGIIGGDGIFPSVGPLPMRDADGAGAAAIQSLKTQDPGTTEPLVQHAAAPKTTVVLGALWEVSAHSKEERVMVQDMTKSHVTSNPVKSQWHERFLKGMHERMGNSVKQDKAKSIEQTLALMGFEILTGCTPKHERCCSLLHFWC